MKNGAANRKEDITDRKRLPLPRLQVVTTDNKVEGSGNNLESGFRTKGKVFSGLKTPSHQNIFGEARLKLHNMRMRRPCEMSTEQQLIKDPLKTAFRDKNYSKFM